MATKKTAETIDAVSFLKMVKAAKNYDALVKAVEKAGGSTQGIKLRLASFRNGGIVIPELEGERRAKPAGKSRKEIMADLATAVGLKFDPKQFKERAPRGSKKAAV